MVLDHILDRVGYQIARGQRVEHAFVAHGDAIVDGYGVELGGKQSVASDLSLYTAADIMEMGVTRHKLSE